jgi:hypothetical protein
VRFFFFNPLAFVLPLTLIGVLDQFFKQFVNSTLVVMINVFPHIH